MTELNSLDKEIQSKDELQSLFLELWHLTIEQVLANDKLKNQMDQYIIWGRQLQNKEITQPKFELLLKAQAEIIKNEIA